MEQFIKNIAYSEVLKLVDQVAYLPGQVVSKTLAQNDAFGLTLFAIPEREGISAHRSTGDAFVTVFEGSALVRIDETDYVVGKGECIVMPAGHPHSVSARENLKFMLVVAFQ